METTLNVVLNHPVAKEIIKQNAPEMLTNPMIEYVKDSQLNLSIAYSAEAKPLYEMIIKAMNDSEPK